ncbi:hypothetical protein Dimus_003279 [Dionaea muscipula]
MARIFKEVQALYGLIAKNVAAQITGDATDSEATPTQSHVPAPLQSVRMEEVTNDEETEEVSKDEASTPKHKKRKLTKEGAAVATGTEEMAATERWKGVAIEPTKIDEAHLTVAPQLVLEVVV